MGCSGGEVRHGQLIISHLSFSVPFVQTPVSVDLIMASPHKDGWVKLTPPDEFSLDNPANTSNGRRNRLVRLDRDNPRFAEGA